MPYLNIIEFIEYIYRFEIVHRAELFHSSTLDVNVYNTFDIECT